MAGRHGWVHDTSVHIEQASILDDLLSLRHKMFHADREPAHTVANRLVFRAGCWAIVGGTELLLALLVRPAAGRDARSEPVAVTPVGGSPASRLGEPPVRRDEWPPRRLRTGVGRTATNADSAC
jgi:hypothetical protein